MQARTADLLAAGKFGEIARLIVAESGFGRRQRVPSVAMARALCGASSVRTLPGETMAWGTAWTTTIKRSFRIYINDDMPAVAKRYAVMWGVASFALPHGADRTVCRRVAEALLTRAYPREGSPSNVIRGYTRLTGGAIGERAARIIGQEGLREEVKSAIRNALHRAVDAKPVANNNDPDLTESPHWSRKVQGGWVRDTLARSRA